MTEYKEHFKDSKEIPFIQDPVEEEGSILNLYDPNNPDIHLFNLIDDEHIKLSGARLQYFKVIMQDGGYDEVYMEYDNKINELEPIIVYGTYNPNVIEVELSNFGLRPTNDQIFTFNKSYIKRRLGREPLAGDIILSDFQNIKYRIHQVQEEAFNLYGVYHYILTASVLRDSADVRDDTIVKTSPKLGKSPVENPYESI